ncbi:MAG: DUF3795 domain-containing protein [Negativicutes bacterium]
MLDENIGTEMIGYCGLCCGDCFMFDGKIAALAKELRAELRKTKFKKFAEEVSKISFFRALEKYDECYEALGGMVKFKCGKTCRNGGGNPWCKIRECCIKKQLDGCWECSGLDECKKNEPSATHGDACRKNCRKIAKIGKAAFVIGKRDW